jgi:hypothetical protein
MLVEWRDFTRRAHHLQKKTSYFKGKRGKCRPSKLLGRQDIGIRKSAWPISLAGTPQSVRNWSK